MSRARTAKITVDGREYTIAPLSIGQLRTLGLMQEEAGSDTLKGLLVDVCAVHMAIMRGQDDAPPLAEFEEAIDGEDLALARFEVFKLSGTIGVNPSGEAKSP